MTLDSSAMAGVYDTVFSGEGLSDSDSFYAWALRKLEPQPGCRLLDVACGQGLLLRAAQARGLAAWGVDLSTVAVDISRRAAPGAVVMLGNGERLPYAEGSFDYVTCLGSLEHYLDPWQGVAEIRRVLKPGGRAAIFLPNSYYLADILWHVLRKGRGPHHRQLVERFATAREWADLLAMMGLHVTRIYTYNFCWPRSQADWRWYRRYPSKFLSLLLGPLTPFNLAYSFLYLCERGAERPDLNDSLPLVLRRGRGGV